MLHLFRTRSSECKPQATQAHLEIPCHFLGLVTSANPTAITAFGTRSVLIPITTAQTFGHSKHISSFNQTFLHFAGFLWGFFFLRWNKSPDFFFRPMGILHPKVRSWQSEWGAGGQRLGRFFCPWEKCLGWLAGRLSGVRLRLFDAWEKPT